MRSTSGAADLKAVWQKTSEGGNQALVIALGGPGLGAAINAALVVVDEALALAWSCGAGSKEN